MVSFLCQPVPGFVANANLRKDRPESSVLHLFLFKLGLIQLIYVNRSANCVHQKMERWRRRITTIGRMLSVLSISQKSGSVTIIRWNPLSFNWFHPSATVEPVLYAKSRERKSGLKWALVCNAINLGVDIIFTSPGTLQLLQLASSNSLILFV